MIDFGKDIDSLATLEVALLANSGNLHLSNPAMLHGPPLSL